MGIERVFFASFFENSFSKGVYERHAHDARPHNSDKMTHGASCEGWALVEQKTEGKNDEKTR